MTDRALRILAWTGSVLSACVIWETVTYIRSSDSNHTGVDPWLLAVVFIPTVVLGVVAVKGRRAILTGLVALLIGAGGLAMLTYIDRTNTMIYYERWLDRGMPDPHE
jgi:hypothetical protein